MPAHPKKSEIETELKIKLSRKDMELVFRSLSALAGASEVKNKFRPRMYYDTPDLDLYQHDLSLRVQYKPGKKGRLGGYEQTVKVEMAPAAPLQEGVMLRKECKDLIASHEPDLAAVTDAAAQGALKPLKGKKLTHIFTAAIERRFFDLQLTAGAESGKVEVAFDVGELILPEGGAHEDFFEIEVELKHGNAVLIDAVKAEILKIAPSAKIQPLSKAAQGSRFYLKHKR